MTDSARSLGYRLSALLGEIYPELDADILASMVLGRLLAGEHNPTQEGPCGGAIRCGRTGCAVDYIRQFDCRMVRISRWIY